MIRITKKIARKIKILEIQKFKDQKNKLREMIMKNYQKVKKIILLK